MFKLLELEPDAFGLDFSDVSLKMVKLEKSQDGFVVSSYNEIPLDVGIIYNGEIRKEDELVGAIKKLLNSVKGKKLNTKYVVSSLPENKAFIEVIQMPLISKEDLRAAVVFEAENYIPLPIEEVYLDSQIVSSAVNHLDHYDVLITALPKKIVDAYLSAIKKAGLKPIVLETESFSKARALIKEESSLSSLAIIDIGSTKTSFIIFSGNCLRFSFCIPISLQEFKEVVAGNLKVGMEEAESILFKRGIDEKLGKDILNTISFLLNGLTGQIKEYIDYYYTHNSNEHLSSDKQRIEKILISGEGANIKDLGNYLSQNLSVVVKNGDPWVNILTPKQREFLEPSSEKSFSFASALGLALRAAKK